jgi:hypothetical protein
MFTCDAQRTAGAACVGLLLAVAGLVAGPLYNKLDHLSFSAPFALPGVTLAAGDYSFEVSHVDSGDVVRVRYRSTNNVAFTGFTQRVQRPRDLPRDRHVVFGEAAAGAAAPIRAWFPIDQTNGYEFVYAAR